MLLAIDIDNNFTKFGVFRDDNLLSTFEITSQKNKSIDEIEIFIKLILKDKNINIANIDNIIISSVVPKLSEIYEKISKNITGKDPMLISAGVKTGINIKCENPKDVGSDRIIRAVAASKTYDGDIIVISASSITTVDYINSKKEFLGGLILPGIDLFEDSLHRQSAKLPQVEIKKSDKFLGNNTISSIQSGIYYGYQNAVLGIVNNIVDQYELKKSNTVILTTGLHSDLLINSKFDIKKDTTLGLNGLKYIYELNKNNLK